MRHEFEHCRGRPTWRNHSQLDNRLLEYLAKVSLKYSVDSDTFFKSFLTATQKRVLTCGELTVECRLKEKDYMVFLITKNHEALGQFHMSEKLLNEKTNPLKEFTNRLSSMKTFTQKVETKSYNIQDLRVGMKRLNLTAEVLKVSQPIQIATRFGSYAIIVNAKIADDTGTINLSIFQSQIGMVSVNDIVQIENAHVAWYRGERQLRIGKHGKISVVQRSIYA
ncbi:hypothetical protein KEJ18_03635 [Candidatus Bathyarchaeota archaeon]|nr:hypothetical protein [Candidatus Bathyarchaeota archaeon]